MTVRQILEDKIKETNAIGLKNDFLGCSCKLNNLMPCGECQGICSLHLMNQEINQESTNTNIIINITCPKCNHKYSYEKPSGYKGRSEKCPNCQYQDPRK